MWCNRQGGPRSYRQEQATRTMIVSVKNELLFRDPKIVKSLSATPCLTIPQEKMSTREHTCERLLTRHVCGVKAGYSAATSDRRTPSKPTIAPTVADYVWKRNKKVNQNDLNRTHPTRTTYRFMFAISPHIRGSWCSGEYFALILYLCNIFCGSHKKCT